MWAGILGHLITGRFVYKFLDPLYRGWTAIISVFIQSMALVTTMFFLQRGLHSLRGSLSWKADCDRQEH